MAPNNQSEMRENGEKVISQIEGKEYKMEIVWKNVILISVIHLFGIYGYYLLVTSAMWTTIIASPFFIAIAGFGGGAGVHRYWSHRAYKANLALRLVLIYLNTMLTQADVYEWTRDHRLHHKHTETDADPYNAKRGFFFSHCGWLMVKKHPEVKEKGKTIDMSDIENDKIARFQRKYYYWMLLVISVLIPTSIPYFFWGETMWNAYFICTSFRILMTTHGAWLVNSAAHLWGDRPYDKNIDARENKLATWGTMGEGYHNYHHVFPQDYSASEWGGNKNFNLPTTFIDFFAWLGWAYDLKKIPVEKIRQRQERTGEQLMKPPQGFWGDVWDLGLGTFIFAWPIWSAYLIRMFILGRL